MIYSISVALELADTLSVELFENSAEICGIVYSDHLRRLVCPEPKTLDIGLGKVHSVCSEVIYNSSALDLLEYRVKVVGSKTKLFCEVDNGYLFAIVFGEFLSF